MVSPMSADQMQAHWNTQAMVDAVRLSRWRDALRAQANVRAAWLGAASAMLLGIVLWMAVASWLQYQIGAIALGFGMLVGWQVKLWGRGVTSQFGWIAALTTVVGICVAHVGTVLLLNAQQAGVSLSTVLTQVPLDQLFYVLRSQFDAWDPAIYAIAIHWAYTGSMRDITDDHLRPLAAGL